MREGHDYAVSIPEETPSGQTVKVEHYQSGNLMIFHAQSPDQSELYFQVTTFPKLTCHDHLVEKQQGFLKRGSVDGAISAVGQTLLGSSNATTFSFEGTLQNRLKVRRFLFVDGDHHTYRIVYDPTSEMNADVLDSFQIKTGV